MDFPDTIAAVASAPGRGAVGIIRVSGPEAPAIAEAVLGCLPPPRLATVSDFLDADGTAIDAGLALYFPRPHSFTGEHVLELQGHGGALVLDLLMRRLLQLGCRAARPGEFSERAFLNGKMNLAQAEAVADLIDAGTHAAARAAVRSMRGEFSAHIDRLERDIIDLRTLAEAAIDFPDEEIDFASNDALQARLRRIIASFDAIAGAARQGALLRDGLHVVIAGKPNAGKSSLMNLLAGQDVAIVTDVPGTTRDVLRQPIQLDGMPLHLVDTAGLRDTADAVEAEGVRRARDEIAKADLVLHIIDATEQNVSADGIDPVAAPVGDAQSAHESAGLPAVPDGVAVTTVFNKIDLLPASRHIGPALQPKAKLGAPRQAPERLYVSAKTGEGLDALRDCLKAAAGFQGEAHALSARRRHVDALARARGSVDEAVRTLAEGRGFELFAEELRLAQRTLGEITGEFSSEDLLAEIFGSFCIGK